MIPIHQKNIDLVIANEFPNEIIHSRSDSTTHFLIFFSIFYTWKSIPIPISSLPILITLKFYIYKKNIGYFNGICFNIYKFWFINLHNFSSK